MEVKKLRTVRLAQLISASGQPEEVTLWTKPDDNPDFKRAVKQKRVMTVIQRNVGTKKDFGLIGFFAKPKAAFWVFPRSLEPSPETKVIGIDYEKLATAKSNGPVFKSSRKNGRSGIALKKRSPFKSRQKLTRRSRRG